MLKFEWDDKKNKSNIQKHGISFEEATSVFQDDDALIIVNEGHSQKKKGSS